MLREDGWFTGDLLDLLIDATFSPVEVSKKSEYFPLILIKIFFRHVFFACCQLLYRIKVTENSAVVLQDIYVISRAPHLVLVVFPPYSLLVEARKGIMTHGACVCLGNIVLGANPLDVYIPDATKTEENQGPC